MPSEILKEKLRTLRSLSLEEYKTAINELLDTKEIAVDELKQIIFYNLVTKELSGKYKDQDLDLALEKLKFLVNEAEFDINTKVSDSFPFIFDYLCEYYSRQAATMAFIRGDHPFKQYTLVMEFLKSKGANASPSSIFYSKLKPDQLNYLLWHKSSLSKVYEKIDEILATIPDNIKNTSGYHTQTDLYADHEKGIVNEITRFGANLVEEYYKKKYNIYYYNCNMIDTGYAVTYIEKMGINKCAILVNDQVFDATGRHGHNQLYIFERTTNKPPVLYCLDSTGLAFANLRGTNNIDTMTSYESRQADYSSCTADALKMAKDILTSDTSFYEKTSHLFRFALKAKHLRTAQLSKVHTNPEDGVDLSIQRHFTKDDRYMISESRKKDLIKGGITLPQFMEENSITMKIGDKEQNFKTFLNNAGFRYVDIINDMVSILSEEELNKIVIERNLSRAATAAIIEESKDSPVEDINQELNKAARLGYNFTITELLNAGATADLNTIKHAIDGAHFGALRLLLDSKKTSWGIEETNEMLEYAASKRDILRHKMERNLRSLELDYNLSPSLENSVEIKTLGVHVPILDSSGFIDTRGWDLYQDDRRYQDKSKIYDFVDLYLEHLKGCERDKQDALKRKISEYSTEDIKPCSKTNRISISTKPKRPRCGISND